MKELALKLYHWLSTNVYTGDDVPHQWHHKYVESGEYVWQSTLEVSLWFTLVLIVIRLLFDLSTALNYNFLNQRHRIHVNNNKFCSKLELKKRIFLKCPIILLSLIDSLLIYISLWGILVYFNFHMLAFLAIVIILTYLSIATFNALSKKEVKFYFDNYDAYLSIDIAPYTRVISYLASKPIASIMMFEFVKDNKRNQINNFLKQLDHE